MKYFVLDFRYEGLKSNFGDHDSSVALSNAIKKVENTLKNTTMSFTHSYAWPDGSLFYYVKADSKEPIRELSWPEGIRLAHVEEIDGSSEAPSGETVSDLLG